ncbi:response regulator transcription factor [Chlamydiota bacterium]
MKKILVVDDEISIAEILKVRLEANGYAVDIAVDGMEALKKIREEKPDLVVLDLMLPKIDGYKIVGMMKHDRNLKEIPVIIFTARTQDSDVNLGLEMGAVAYIPKPFDPQLLLSTIKQHIKE